MEIIKLKNEKLIIEPDNPDLYQEVEQFLSDNNTQTKDIPVTIIVNPPIRTVVEDTDKLSEILVELSVAYRSEGNYFIELHPSSHGIVVTFLIGHTATTVSHEIGSC
jgi:hypothetical protein